MISSIACRSVRPVMSSSSSTTTGTASSCIVSRTSRSLLLSSSGSSRSQNSSLFGSAATSTNHRSHSTTGSLLTPEEKREIFLRKSKELHQAMDGVLGERNTAKQTIARVASESQKQQQQAATSTTTSKTNTNNNNNTRQTKFKQAMLNAGVSFVTVVLAAQVLKTSVAKRKAEISLEAALEVLEDKRILLEKVQNESDLRNLAKQCVDIIQKNDGTSNNTVKSSTKKSSWGGWIFGYTNDTEEADLFRDDDDITSNPNVHLEERIFRTLSNHVHQVVGDAAYTNDEKDRREFQKLASNNNNNNDEIETTNQQQQQQLPERTTDSTDESERLLNELVQEQLSTINDGTTTQKVVKRQVFQI